MRKPSKKSDVFVETNVYVNFEMGDTVPI